MASTDDDLDAALLGVLPAAPSEADLDAALLTAAPAVAAAAPPASGQKPARGAAFGAGLARGAADVGQTALRLLDVPAQWLEDRFGTLGGPSVAEARQNRLTGLEAQDEAFGDSGWYTAGRVGGNVLLTAPVLAQTAAAAGGVPALARVGQALNATRKGRVAADVLSGSALGAEGAAMVSGGYDAPVAEQVGLGALFGGVLQPVARPLLQAGRTAANRLFGAPKAPAAAAPNPLTAGAAQQTDDAVRAAGAQTGAAGGPQITVTPQARQANLEALNLRPTSGITTRDPIQWADEDALAKTRVGTPLRELFEHNNQTLRGHLTGVAEKAGGASHTAYDASAAVIKAVDDKWDELGSEASKLYSMVRKAKGAEFGAKPQRLLEQLDEIADATEGMPIADAVKRRLTRYGVLGDDATRPGLTVNQAEELRKFIAREGAGNPSRKEFGRQLIEALDDDVLETTGDDAFKAARSAFKAKMQEFGIGDKGRGVANLTRAIVDGKVTPDSLIERYVAGRSGTAEDLNKLVKSLSSGTPEQVKRGTAALADLRRQTARWIAEKATNGNIDEGIVSYPRLRQALNQIGEQKIVTLFGKDGAEYYGKLLLAAHDTTVVPLKAPVNFSNTTNELMRRLGEGAANLIGLSHSPEANIAMRILSAATQGAKDQRAVKNALMLVPPKAMAVRPPPPAPLAPWLQALPPALAAPGGAAAAVPNRLTE